MKRPVGLIAGGIVGCLAAGLVGAVIGAGIVTRLGNRVQLSGDAARTEAQLTALQADKLGLRRENSVLALQQDDLAETNRALTARLDELSQAADAAQAAGSIAGGPDVVTRVHEHQ